MRTNIVIEDKLMADAMHIGGFTTKRETVQQALQLFIKLKRQERIKDFRGKLRWEGDLDAMRTDR